MAVKNKKFFKLQTNFVVLICIVVAVSVLVMDFLIVNKVSADVKKNMVQELEKVANIISYSPMVKERLVAGKDYEEVTRYIEGIQQITGVSFIVITDMNRMRVAHTNKQRIGDYYSSQDIDIALGGQNTSSVDRGPSGLTLRSFFPIYTQENKQIGVVGVGISIDRVMEGINNNRRIVAFGSLCGLLVGIIGAAALAEHIKTATLGMEPMDMAHMLEERNAILESVREGILVVDKDTRLTLVNAAAAALFEKSGVAENPVGQNIRKYVPDSRLEEVIHSGVNEYDQEQEINGVQTVVSRVPIRVDGEMVGAVVTFRDKTEIRQLAEKLSDVRIYADELRANTHEFMNRLQVILGMLHMGAYEELKKYVQQISRKYQVDVSSIIRNIKEPVIAGLLLGKMSRANEVHIDVVMNDACCLPDLRHSGDLVNELVCVVGNLLDNAIDAVQSAETKRIELLIKADDVSETIEIAVTDSGSGVKKEIEDDIWKKGYSTKGNNRGIGLYSIKNIADNRNGWCRAEKAEYGTKFTVILPYDAEEMS